MHNDEGFREIQLNGKQLVFLFMAATVVSVVIFLCGVLVGRGVRGGPAEAASQEITAEAAVPRPQDAAPPAMTAGGTAGESKPEAAAAGELSYPGRLLGDGQADEKLKPAPREAESPAPAAAPIVQEPVAAPPAPRPAPSPPPAAPAASASSTGPPALDPSGPGFAVQVSISETRREADQLARQLVAKGYPAFVVDPVKGTPKQIYRIRVGKYRNRKEAEEVMARLEKNEHFKPWIAR